MPFPPVPAYPDELDSDYTLFLVYNTTETRLSADNSAWALEIPIIPVGDDELEIWADNGFANLDGELLYYDSVEKNLSEKVIKLKGCARNLGGEQTKFNPRGTWIRSYVVAEHHNQMVSAVLKTENFIGFNFDDRKGTLDWRIRNLEALEVIFDDFNCPDINFTFNVLENDPTRGILTRYLLEITPPGTINSFRLDFGDGEFTTTDFDGTHRYAVNTRIDPVVTVGNDKCQTIITPVERGNPAEPPAILEPGFEIPIPEFPDIPDFNFVPCEVPEPDINLPPLVVPCVSLAGIPSIDSPIDLFSQIVIIGPDHPVQILHSVVSIIANIPSFILIEPPIPPTIIIEPPIPPTIVIIPPASSIVLALDATDLPRLEVDWGAPPNMEVALTLAKQVKMPQTFGANKQLVQEFGTEFADLFEAADTMKVEYETVGIPSEIKIIPPDMPSVKFDVTDIPKTIKLDAKDVKIPTDIKIYGPDSPIPNTIKLEGDNLPDAIDLVYKGEPIPVEVKTEVEVKIEPIKGIPDKIILEIPKPIPEKIILESNLPDRIILEGPRSIPLEIPENLGIPVIFPDIMPEIPLVYRGAPIELKITMDEIMSKDAEGRNCVMITPCPVTGR